MFIQQFPDILKYTSLKSVYYNGYTYSNLNYLLQGTYYYAGADGFKTGYTVNAGHCLCSTAVVDGVRLIVVVCKSTSGRQFLDSQNLFNYGYEVLEEEPFYYHDSSYHPASVPTYEKYRQLDVNFQSINGWVRPAEEITRGEFAITLVSLLEKRWYLPSEHIMVQYVPPVPDLDQYYGKETILRGISYGFFPYEYQGEAFYPEQLLTREEMYQILQMTQNVLNMEYVNLDWMMPPEQPEPVPEPEPEPEPEYAHGATQGESTVNKEEVETPPEIPEEPEVFLSFYLAVLPQPLLVVEVLSQEFYESPIYQEYLVQLEEYFKKLEEYEQYNAQRLSTVLRGDALLAIERSFFPYELYVPEDAYL